jgi:hypothetical protein
MASSDDSALSSDAVSERWTEARQIFSQAAYGPEDLKVICEAFDRAWEAIRPILDDNPLAHEAARLKLANMILGIASSHKLDQARAGQSAPANPGETAGPV